MQTSRKKLFVSANIKLCLNEYALQQDCEQDAEFADFEVVPMGASFSKYHTDSVRKQGCTRPLHSRPHFYYVPDLLLFSILS